MGSLELVEVKLQPTDVCSLFRISLLRALDLWSCLCIVKLSCQLWLGICELGRSLLECFLNFYELLSHIVHLPLILFKVLLDFHARPAGLLSFLHPTLHFLNELSKLSILFVFYLQSTDNLVVFLLDLGNNQIPLLEFLLNNFKLLGVSEGILAFDNFLKLLPQPHAFIHIKFDFDFCLMRASVFYVALQQFDLVLSLS